MARAVILAAALALAPFAHSPAFADYGAVAYDGTARKYGTAWTEATQAGAKDAAVRDCGSDKCTVRFGVPPKMCGALATPDSGEAWGGAVRKTLDAANFAAIKNCQKHAKQKCTVLTSKCAK